MADATTQTVPKGSDAKPPLVEIKNGKLNLKQRILAFDKMSETMQEIVQFRESLEKRIEEKQPPLDEITVEFKPLIAKLVHESDKTITALAKHVQSQLIPAQDEDEDEALQTATAALPLEVLDRAIKSVAERVDYGLETSVAGARISAGWHIWRWEVKQERRGWLPKAAKEKVEARLAERIQAKKDVLSLFEALSDQERKAILNVKEVKSVTVALQDSTGSTISANGQNSNSAQDKGQTNHPQSAAQPGLGRPKKPIDPEKAAKEKEKEEKKIARIEREKKEKAAQAKSRSLMANFFTKAPKAKSSPTPSRSTSITKDVGLDAAGPSILTSDYSKAFKPFVVKRDVELAPINAFHQRRSGKQYRETRDPKAGATVIVLDDDDDDRNTEDVQMRDVESLCNLGQLTPGERLRDSIALMGLSRRRRRTAPSGLKSYHPCVVRNILNQLNEAEIAGDDQRVRSLLSLLRDRRQIPAKVLIFSEDARPGYFGTWTRNSREVGPRTPFSRDVVALDYTYDSGEEWEEESGEADDVVEDAEDDDAGDEPDSDLDSWLVDDDEVDEPGTPIEERAPSPGMPPMLSVSKRKPIDEPKKSTKRRKVVIPLVPFTKGPCWEEDVGKCAYEPFKHYRIQLLNDTPFPIDPFKFVASSVSAPIEKKAVAGTSGSTDAQFVVPALPERLTKPAVEAGTSQKSSPSTKRAAAPITPKTPFPDAHLPVLVAKIQSMQTGNIAGIVEMVYHELRVHKVKKNAIESKLREIAEKAKEKKVWVVKSEYLTS
ncbi:hypothetical protein BXZ70DRAFT_282272 [Cristinia sonorae]|uniref:Uncharacterized protein n=1 Tax=Cristinia sonorae TaxID=1940300 RepID=A0A8K0XUR1_9AGAR|nr:hypothetical protein BXZ70DRAFT_282272 [Cristinia sonorae]